MTTRVVHVHDNIPGAVYIGRAVPRRGIKASKWANPYKIGRDGNRADVIAKYWFALMYGDKRHLLADLPELRDKDLACWCRHDGEARTGDNECHGDVLVDLLERYTDDELRTMGGER
jgi:hypothetical protein